MTYSGGSAGSAKVPHNDINDLQRRFRKVPQGSASFSPSFFDKIVGSQHPIGCPENALDELQRRRQRAAFDPVDCATGRIRPERHAGRRDALFGAISSERMLVHNVNL